MPTAPENPADSSSKPPSAEQSPAAQRADLRQMFTLVDGILPFEACLYYQVLPLSIEGSCLNLGMVNPADRAAADYVRRLVAYINCSIVSWQISSEWHRDTLSKYLSHSAKAKQKAEQASQVQEPAAPPVQEQRRAPNRQDDYREQNQQPTLVVDTPEQLEASAAAAASQPSTATPQSTPSSQPRKQPEPTVPAQPTARPGVRPPLHLQVESEHQLGSIESLRSLAPKEMMQALLSRVLDEGIGRLYFERLADSGRVLWSKDGVPQSILDNLQIDSFQGVINEFKLLTHISLIPLQKAKQVEIERLYNNTRVLLRFRVMPGAQGEEATLQVLRGAALKFYQQQQIDKLGRDALGIAQTLQQRICEIRDRARQNLVVATNQVEALPAIIELLKQMELEVQNILRTQNSGAKPPEPPQTDA
ncbi:GspE/PulE/PilB domain-containing protein [Almyronema epifaneia]|uniref:Type II secretion system protein GspE N-terminal domain-containing protein n=1 Tax=Almyronema epifaneia S1 TaxID=2991925 RepID=A0ABW6IHB3_9CYAN